MYYTCDTPGPAIYSNPPGMSLVMKILAAILVAAAASSAQTTQPVILKTGAEMMDALRDPRFNVRYEAIISIARMHADPRLTDALIAVMRAPLVSQASLGSDLGDKPPGGSRLAIRCGSDRGAETRDIRRHFKA